MVRGYQKKIVFVKNTGSKIFDEACFVVSKKYQENESSPDLKEKEMICEANRIIEENLLDGKKYLKRSSFAKFMQSCKKMLKFCIVPYLLGALSALLTVFIIANL